MPVISLSSGRSPVDIDLEEISQLAVMCSKRLTRAQLGDSAPVVEEVLTKLAAVTHAATCRLIEFRDSGAVARVYSSETPGDADGGRATGEADWLAERLARGELVIAPEELPFDAVTARKQDRRSGSCSILGVPGSIAGRVACALVVDGSRVARRWPQPLVERLQLLAEILGTALRRLRPETFRSMDSVERLNTRLAADNAYLKEEIKTYHDFDEIVGDSVPLRLALTRLAQVAPTHSSVLLLGATGTGKELFARAVHARSRRHHRPLVRVNCAALPPTLVESELFGHEKGAFTGAVGARQGRFELADGGTIFLDEIGDLSPEVQVKFLRVLQEGEFERVGSSRTTRVDVRVIAATHRNLETEVAEGRFRADLYYRLSVYPIYVPSLRERLEDIPALVWFFIQRHQRELGRRITRVPEPLMKTLQQYTWPGNVRELQNVIERAMIASSGNTLELDEALPFLGQHMVPTGTTDSLDEIQRRHIEAVLERCGWRINGAGNAAERLGIHPNTLRFRMRKLGVKGAARAQSPAPARLSS